MEKNDKIKLKIIDMGAAGEGIARDNCGITVFVPQAIEGELCEVQIVHKKNNIAFGRLLKILEKSDKRIEPICPVHSVCGGCSMQHIDRKLELFIKENNLKVCMRKYAGITEYPHFKMIYADNDYSYRNKLQLPIKEIKGKIELGFYKKKSHMIVPINSCPLHGEWATKLIKIVKKYAEENNLSAYDEIANKGLLRHLVARYVGGKLSVILVINGKNLPNYKKLIELLLFNFEDFTLGYSVNNKLTNLIMEDNYTPLYGEKSVNLAYMGLKIALSPLSFLQINTEIASLIYKKVVEMIPPNSIVIDAYSGIGIMTALVASHARIVYGIEINQDAKSDADRIMELNGIKNVINYVGDVKSILQDIISIYGYGKNQDSSKLNNYMLNYNREDLSASRQDSVINAKIIQESTISDKNSHSNQEKPYLGINGLSIEGNTNDNNSHSNQEKTSLENNGLSIEGNTNDNNSHSNQEKPSLENNGLTIEDKSNIIEKNHQITNNMTVILDPPRKGCDTEVLDILLKFLPEQIIYISCNPATLSRDLSQLLPHYHLTSITAYDMFPRTEHLETLVCLSRYK